VVYLQLTADAKGGVAGTAVMRSPSSNEIVAPIKAGSFNGRTGVLKIEGEGTHPDAGTPLRFQIEGKLDGDTLRVTATIGDRTSSRAFNRINRKPPG
jgi:hypothetical protein